MNAAVTGPGVFMYYKVENDFSEATMIRDSSDDFRNDDSSMNLTSHAWTQDTGRLVVGSDQGELLFLNADGEKDYFHQDSPWGFEIQTILTHPRGFLVAAGEDNGVWNYMSNKPTEDDPEPQPYSLTVDGQNLNFSEI
jgi:hypothetical protein